MALVRAGQNDREVSRRTGIPRGTIRDWRAGKCRSAPRHPKLEPNESRLDALNCVHDFSLLPSRSYAYLLGLYLGDGYIARHPRAWRLRLYMASKYPAIIEEAARAMELVMPGQRALRLPRSDSACTEISMYSMHWVCFFPQHGPGRKHTRQIRLESWQEKIRALQHEAFLRGLIHSDGCRIVASDRGRPSVRYLFSNRSEDIKDLYCESLDALGIPWTRPCDRQIAVYRMEAAAKMDEFIGPKR